LKLILLMAAALFIGSIPTGLIIAKLRGIDIRNTGSGNIGATNMLRSAGKWPALFTLIGDMAKGVAAVLIARHFFGGEPVYEGIAGICAVLGHDFSIFLRCRGGKGVATSLGVLAVYSPQICLATIIIWLMTAFVTRYSSLSALVSFGIMPLAVYMGDSRAKLPAALFMSVLLYLRHRTNIERLIKGQEPRIGRKA